jgi:hypothetical protein
MLGLAAISAGLTAGIAAAEVEPAELAFANGVFEGEKIRVVAGDVDGRGLVTVELYKGERLWTAYPYDRVFVDDEQTNIRQLTDITLDPAQSSDGFNFTATQQGTALSCTILLYADSTITCTRVGMSYAPAIAPACATNFKSHQQRFQCNFIREHNQGKGFDDDGIVATCAATFRFEALRNGCMLYAYGMPAEFETVRSTCLAAYKTQEERNFCFWITLAQANPKDRVDIAHIATCDKLYDDDKWTTACAFTLDSGMAASETKLPRASADKRKPGEKDTAPVVPAAPVTSSVSGATIDVTTVKLGEVTTRVTGGMVGTEPVILIDRYASATDLTGTEVISRVVIGKEKEARSLRELSLVEKVKVSGEIITFKAVRAGKHLSCRANLTDAWATCR